MTSIFHKLTMKNIIPVNADNQADWAKLCVKLWPEYEYDFFITQREKMFQDQFLYMRGDCAAAFLSLSARRDYVEGTYSSPVGYIEGIYVEPEFRNLGIARELTEFAKAWSKQKGCTELASDCYLSNNDSRKFHNAVGFEEAGVIVHFVMKLKD